MHHRLMLFDALFPVHIRKTMYQHMKQWMRSWSAQHVLIHTPPLLLIALITALDQQRFNKAIATSSPKTLMGHHTAVS